MLHGVRVLDLTDASGCLAGRILADLGADVVLAEPEGGHPDRARHPYVAAAFNAGKRSTSDAATRDLIARADIVIETGITDRFEQLATERTVWVAITPFGRTGPKARWRATDLTVQAQSGVQWMTGAPDEPPVRCTAPTSWFHGCADAVAGALIALWQRDSSGRGQLVDVSMHESHVMATMSRVAQFGLTGSRGKRAGALMRQGSSVQREIWPCADGHVTFGLRGGPARIPGLKRLVAWMVEDNVATPALTERDWDAYSHTALTQAEVSAISEPIARFFAGKTMTELFDAALERGLMLAPCNTAKEIAESRQLQARAFFTVVNDPEFGPVPLPRAFVAADGVPGIGGPQPAAGSTTIDWDLGVVPAGSRPFEDLKVLEFGSGAAGPLATRYFADHGATVIKVESQQRPDFLRIYALTPAQRSLDASPMFAAFNCNKQAITLNLKHPDARAIVLGLVAWADVVAENFAPGTINQLGFSFEQLRETRPDLVMISTCLNGQTGPERDYPGFGGQGSAISGFNHLTGYREPLGPFGTITDSLSPRFAAIAMLAALHRRARTGEGAHLDLSQVECAVYCLADTIIEYATTGSAPGRLGNRARTAAPHGVFPCAGEDRWIALACWDDEDWTRLARAMDDAAPPGFDTFEHRRAREDALEDAIAAWTQTQDRDELGARLRDAGLEAAEVLDLGDLFDDPQLRHRGHFATMPHPVIGEHAYEALGIRLEDPAALMRSPGPTLGRNNDAVYGGILGLDVDAIARLRDDGVLS